ncbi:DUF4070 domain-containing protein [Breoghania sp. L-A4]|nr:DUF4070 domain-containing protein [Breoghania sp. L-A4]
MAENGADRRAHTTAARVSDHVPNTGARRRLSICLIGPKFQPSFWGREHALDVQPGEKRAWMMGGALPLLAALTPEGHDVRLIDEAVEDIDFDALGAYDIIGVTGMIVQRDRMRDILLRLRALPALVVVGGPYAAIDEPFFDGLCDVLFVGEAEETWPRFIEDFAAHRPIERRYEQTGRTDMTRLPKPRIDLLKQQHYMAASLQYSRGCPFRCEFCDIIVIYGRKPRVKTPGQVIAELDDLRRDGIKVCFIVDDNFIGNKREAKLLLPEIIRWQEAHGYPLIISTEATINLADDPELMDLMYRANFREVFIGLESPREASLRETKKIQNVHGDPLAEKLARIRDAGIVVSAGFIVGFDNDDASIFDEQYRFIQDNAIGQASLGILMALPRTPLHARLEREGRLRDDGDTCNFEPAQMSRAELVDGCAELLRRLYEPEAFFERVLGNIAASRPFREKRARILAWSKPADRASPLTAARDLLVMTLRLGRALRRDRMLLSMGRRYLALYRGTGGRGPRLSLHNFLSLCILHRHHYKLSRTGGDARSLNMFDAAPLGASSRPALPPAYGPPKMARESLRQA